MVWAACDEGRPLPLFLLQKLMKRRLCGNPVVIVGVLFGMPKSRDGAYRQSLESKDTRDE